MGNILSSDNLFPMIAVTPQRLKNRNHGLDWSVSTGKSFLCYKCEGNIGFVLCFLSSKALISGFFRKWALLSIYSFENYWMDKFCLVFSKLQWNIASYRRGYWSCDCLDRYLRLKSVECRGMQFWADPWNRYFILSS